MLMDTTMAGGVNAIMTKCVSPSSKYGFQLHHNHSWEDTENNLTARTSYINNRFWNAILS